MEPDLILPWSPAQPGAQQGGPEVRRQPSRAQGLWEVGSSSPSCMSVELDMGWSPVSCASWPQSQCGGRVMGMPLSLHRCGPSCSFLFPLNLAPRMWLPVSLGQGTRRGLPAAAALYSALHTSGLLLSELQVGPGPRLAHPSGLSSTHLAGGQTVSQALKAPH